MINSPRPDTVNIAGMNIHNVSFGEVLSLIQKRIEYKDNIYIVTPNTHHIMAFQEDEEFRKIYREAYLVLADGMPVVWASKFLGTPLREKISGSDLVPAICGLSAKNGYSVFLLGGRPEAAEKARDKLIKLYPGLKIAGVYAPPFGFENNLQENEKIIRMIKKSRPDILLVGLGAPKQEKWIYRHYKELEFPVSIGVGVTFEFLAGIVRRAPKWMQKSGLEWLWRLIQEPGRLWKRYLIKDIGFFWLVLKDRIGINTGY